MNDLIARLRIPHPTCEPIFREAADELERLRTQVAFLLSYQKDIEESNGRKAS